MGHHSFSCRFAAGEWAREMDRNRIVGWWLALVLIVMSGTAYADAVPKTPTAPSPAAGSTNLPLPINLSWQSGRATSYDVYLGNSPSPPKVANVLAAAYAPSLQPGT